MALKGISVSSGKRLVLAFVFSGLTTASCVQAADGQRDGFLNALGGVLHRELETQTNSTNRTIESLRSLDALLTNTNAPAFQATNTTSLVSRLGSMLGGNSIAGTNSPAGTNLVQKMKSWLDAQHSAGTNAASSTTNMLAQRSWISLTNWLALHAKTNRNSAAAADGGTNLVQKVRDWAKLELQSHTNSADPMNSKLTALAHLFQSSTNSTSSR